jgi:hypothetical protein
MTVGMAGGPTDVDEGGRGGFGMALLQNVDRCE